MEDLELIFKSMRKADWSKASVTFFIVRSNITAHTHEAHYITERVAVDDNLEKKLIDMIHIKIKGTEKIKEYHNNYAADSKGLLLSIPISQTDMEKIIPNLKGKKLSKRITKFGDIKKTDFYIIRVDGVMYDDNGNSQPLYAARSTSRTWTIKRVATLFNVAYENNVLIDIDKEEVFKIDGAIDFYAYNDTVFIADKKNFEIALNFREQLIRGRDEILEDFKKYKIFEDTELLATCIGDDMRYLRKLAQIKESAYYKDNNFLDKLKKVNTDEKWGIQYSNDGEIIVTKENLKTVLNALNNDRLSSKITGEDFFVVGKDKVKKN